MGTTPAKELLKMWQTETLSPEMVIGHLLQNLANLQTAIDATNTAYFSLRADLEEIRRQLPPTKNPKE